MTLPELPAGQFARAVIAADHPVEFKAADVLTPSEFITLIQKGQEDLAKTRLKEFISGLPATYDPEISATLEEFENAETYGFAGKAAQEAVTQGVSEATFLKIQEALGEVGVAHNTFQNAYLTTKIEMDNLAKDLKGGDDFRFHSS